MANFGPDQLGGTHSMYTLILVNFLSIPCNLLINYVCVATLHVI
jgi:hypothetical protein